MTAGASAYVFAGISGLTGVSQINFSLDGAAFSTDRTAPFDFAGTTNHRSCRACALDAIPFESNLLTLGTHHITATAVLKSGSPVVFDASFTVANTTPHSLMVSSSSSRTSPTPLAGATLSGLRYMFLGSANDSIAGLDKVSFVLDGSKMGSDATVPYDASGTRRDLAIAFDTRRLRNGSHRLVAIVRLAGGGQVVYTADFTVAN